ncbi:hypothetical protein OIU76_000288 [Salix suchowensis]|nr:hypothetical protein OIU76_000288 [Salix suchowensis]
MAVIRLDKTADQIEHVLFSSLMDGNGSVPASRATSDPLASNAWEEVIVGFSRRYAAYTSGVQLIMDAVQSRHKVYNDAVQSRHKVYNEPATSAQDTLRKAKRALKIVVGVVVVVGAGVVAAVGAPTAMTIASRPEVAALMKKVGPELVAVMKDIGPEVLAMLKDAGPEVTGVVRSLGPQIVTAVIAMMTKWMAGPHQQ